MSGTNPTDIDCHKIDDCTLALLYPVTSENRYGAWAWKSFDWATMDRLHRKGYISNPKSEAMSIVLSADGAARSKNCLRSCSPNNTRIVLKARRAVRAGGQGRYHIMKKTAVRCMHVGLVCGALLGCTCRDDGTGRMRAYLMRNSAVIPSVADGAFDIPANIFKDTIDGYEVILTGESHGMAVNYALRRAFLSYLKEAADIKYLLLELGPSQAGTLNRYLETGDRALLDEMYSYLEGTYEWTQESYAFWQDLYTFNRALPLEERLTCVGIDIEHQVGYALAYLRTLLPNEAPPERITAQIELIRAFTRDSRTGFDAAAELSASIAVNEGDYRRYLREDFFEFRLIVESMWAAREAYLARQSGGGRVAFQQSRDVAMYANFVRLYDRLPEGRYWGHFGGAHIFHKSSNGTQWFGVGLERDDSPVTGRVLSIYFAYERCTAMTRKNSTYSTSSAANVRPGLFDFYRGSEPVLFKLIGEDSPARFCQAVLHGEPGGSAEYFDYLLLVRDATPTRPLTMSDDQD
jgi:hypothetical protein